MKTANTCERCGDSASVLVCGLCPVCISVDLTLAARWRADEATRGPDYHTAMGPGGAHIVAPILYCEGCDKKTPHKLRIQTTWVCACGSGWAVANEKRGSTEPTR